MKRVLILIAPGYEEIEAITVVDILRRAGARVTMAGTVVGPIEGSRGVKVEPDVLLENIHAQEGFDLVILPGGLQGITHLQSDPRVSELVKSMNGRRKMIGAICAAPTVLQALGILKGRSITSHPSVKDKLTGVHYLEDRVVIDGNIITSRSPGTAMEFAMKLVEILFGSQHVETVNSGIMARL